MFADIQWTCINPFELLSIPLYDKEFYRLKKEKGS